MKVLVVSRYKEGYEGKVAPFVKAQVESVRRQGVDCEFFLVKGKGVAGYLGQLKVLKKGITKKHGGKLKYFFSISFVNRDGE